MSEDANINELGDISMAPTETGDVAAPTTAADNSLELTVNDLQLLRQVIDIATARGAFKANEMVTVGTVFNKLETFLNAIAQQQKQGGE